jgi:hypothetical protein
MEAGGDKNGLGTLFGFGLRYVYSPSTFSHLNLLLSIGSIVAHIPYVLPFLVAITGKSGPIMRAEEFSRGRVLKRLETGASRKDLFYHLVRQCARAQHVHSLGPTDYRVARGFPRRSAPLSMTSHKMGL